jgi:hypothetical protein
MLDKTEQSDRASNPNEQPKSCYCSALPKGAGPCLPIRDGWPPLVGKAGSRCRPTWAAIEQPHRSDTLLLLLIRDLPKTQAPPAAGLFLAS